MKKNNQNARNAGSPGPNLRRDSSAPTGSYPAFSNEAVAHCLADLKRQLELRQAMH